MLQKGNEVEKKHNWDTHPRVYKRQEFDEFNTFI